MKHPGNFELKYDQRHRIFYRFKLSRQMAPTLTMSRPLDLLSTPTQSPIEFQLHFYRFPSKSNWVLIRIESKPYPNPVGFLSNADRSPIVSHKVPAKVLCDTHRLHTPFFVFEIKLRSNSNPTRFAFEKSFQAPSRVILSSFQTSIVFLLACP